ncbi:MAG: 5-formyltetrahydrofolate cyclo-ligase [Bacilli bacterium]|nr:5-formyltetrahydrofolate cyclo-ligase [Bacilli bacterium]
MTKKEIRNQFQEIRNNIGNRKSREDILVSSILEMEKVLSSRIISIFVSIGTEIDTHPIIDGLLRIGKRVVIPFIYGHDDMVMKEIKSLDELVRVGKYEIEEAPATNAIVKPEDIDLIIVPGLAFDDANYRLGYGGGYYDRYLKKTKAYSLGICFSEQTVEELPHDDLDVPLDNVFVV